MRNVSISNLDRPRVLLVEDEAAFAAMLRYNLETHGFLVDPVTSAGITWVDGPGQWLGDSVVMPVSSGLLLLRTSSSSLTIDQVIHVDSATEPNGRLWEPRFADSSARTIVTWSDLAGTESGDSAQLVCDHRWLGGNGGDHGDPDAAALHGLNQSAEVAVA